MGALKKGTESPSQPALIEWGVAMLAMPGQPEAGDLHLVKAFSNGILVAAIDGLGHGDEALSAAKIAATTLEAHADEPLISLIKRCHERLTKTRGVVMTVASLDSRESMMTWLGVGNVEGVLFEADAEANPRRLSVMLRGGVVGYQLPLLRTSVASISQGDTLVLATDGVGSWFADRVVLSDPPQRIADRILAECAKGTDDALVLVARYVGARR